ncbi:hypothetical protein LOTGIDRAFT_184819 [Lottia gigantea]|uniref:V-SNARE coiled-coil homology domain-containing protein n=1 Tax=Lottia gigantea TaxID=225164 RepID=V4B3C4_LOTGI|nr:hypothetical protein LOTGIDRAFT_184819 [Lottia gigantea]ESP04833.1 hypothetical protein LOTGIDRAFT_184819 [Lottia gigantea]
MPPKFVRVPGRNDINNSRDVERQNLLAGDSDDEDFFYKGPNVNTGSLRGDPAMDRLRNQVSDVVGVMKDNVGKVIDRGDRLEDLQDKSDNLASNSDMFRSRAKSLHKTMYWKNCRMKLILAMIIIILLGIVIIPIIVHYQQ